MPSQCKPLIHITHARLNRRAIYHKQNLNSNIMLHLDSGRNVSLDTLAKTLIQNWYCNGLNPLPNIRREFGVETRFEYENATNINYMRMNPE